MNKKIRHTFDLILVLFIFSITGLTTVYISAYIVSLFGLEKWSFFYILMLIFLITPIHNILLLFYAFLFGRFNYFYEKEKKLFKKIAGLFTTD